MTYFYHEDQLTCAHCKTPIQSSLHDRHACYWKELEERPIGMAALILDGQFSTFNVMEHRIARGIWERIKARAKPKRVRKVKMFNTTNLEIWETWVLRGDKAVA